MGYENLVYKNLGQARKDLKVSYLGSVAHSAKLMHSMEEKNIATYGVYLAAADLSGYNVCPNHAACKEHCLFGSGNTMVDMLSERNHIINSRIKKTRLFFENRDFFMQMLIAEIRLARLMAELNGNEFSVRLNLTSDIRIIDFVYNGKNILEIFPDVKMYDYTKVFSNLQYSHLYPNYDLTFSYNGYNWQACKKALKGGNRVAIVVAGNQLPKTFGGYPVISGDGYDARYLDDNQTIVALKLKMVANHIKNHEYKKPKTPFVVEPNNPLCGW